MFQSHRMASFWPQNIITISVGFYKTNTTWSLLLYRILVCILQLFHNALLFQILETDIWNDNSKRNKDRCAYH